MGNVLVVQAWQPGGFARRVICNMRVSNFDYQLDWIAKYRGD